MAMIRNGSLLTVLLFASSLLAGCYLHRDPGSFHLEVAVPELPATLDPHLNDRPGTRYANAAMFDTLTTIDQKGDLQPSLAISWRSIGPTTWEFKLRQGVRFHTGEEFNANAVAYNVRRVLRRDFKSPVLKDVPTLLGANTPDFQTVVISTRRMDPILPRRLAALYIVPPSYVARVGDEQFGREPIGSGPFKLYSFDPGEMLTLEAQKGSWRGPPQLRYIELKQYPDAAARAAALRGGAAAIALDVPVDQRATLAQDGFRVEEIAVSTSKLIILDSTQEGTPLVHARVREALNYAVDKEKLVREVAGLGVPLEGQVVGREAYGYTDKLRTPYPYDLAEAKRLMTEAGFPFGFELTVFYSDGPDGRDRRELEAIASDLEKLNVKLVLRGANPTIHQQRRLAGALTPAYYDTFPYYPTQDASAVLDLFGLEKTETLSPTYDNEDFDQIYKPTTRTGQTPAIRLQGLQVSMDLLSEQPGAIYLYQPMRVNALRKGINDFKAYSNLLINFDKTSR